jgi:mevalonate kinase
MTQPALKKTFYSNGKLLITGEYTVLDGAKALALPTKTGQYLDIEPLEGSTIKWTSYDADNSVWYEEELAISDIKDNRQEASQAETNTLIKILHEAWLVNPEVLNSGYTITTRLTFPRQWGLGTSSTLINNIAEWFGINAFDLLTKSFGGSGYDIACAQNDSPILYQLENGEPIVEPVEFNPAFTDNIWFVYLNRKQNSREAIARYREHRRSIAPVLTKIDAITQQVLDTDKLSAFCTAIEEHEAIMSEVLGLPTTKQLVFPDFNGTVKSLGAWGGDFVLAAANENPEAYFKSKGFETIIPYREMILNQKVN